MHVCPRKITAKERALNFDVEQLEGVQHLDEPHPNHALRIALPYQRK